jgi:hypothetical protein
MLAPACRRNRGNRTLNDLQQCLLDALTRNISCDRRVFAFSGNLVYFIDIDYAALGLFRIIFAILQKALDDIFYILADITGLCQCCCVCDCERNVQKSRKGSGKQRFA